MHEGAYSGPPYSTLLNMRGVESPFNHALHSNTQPGYRPDVHVEVGVVLRLELVTSTA